MVIDDKEGKIMYKDSEKTTKEERIVYKDSEKTTKGERNKDISDRGRT